MALAKYHSNHLWDTEGTTPHCSLLYLGTQWPTIHKYWMPSLENLYLWSANVRPAAEDSFKGVSS